MKILIVGDDAASYRQLEKSLTRWGYSISKAENGQLAIERLKDSRIDIILTDGQLSDMRVLELSQKIRSLDFKYYIYIIVINAKGKLPDVARGDDDGADDYLTKPLNLDELQARLEIGARIIQLETELNQKYLAIKRNYYQSIQMFTRMLGIYDKQLGNHSKSVGKLALELARRHQWVSGEDYPIIEAAGLLHDVGLIGLPGTLSAKSAQEMTGDEKILYHTHPERGENVLVQIDLLKPVAQLVRSHHEQYNGRGFPDGLSGSQIPLGAYIVSAASIYDNMVHQQQLPFNTIFEKLQQIRGYQLPSDLVDHLLEINLEKKDEESKRTHRQIDIDDIKAGMVLAADIHMKSGAFVMGALTMLDESMIGKLKRYYDLGNISDRVFINK